jgi:hypothetical protein
VSEHRNEATSEATSAHSFDPRSLRALVVVPIVLALTLSAFAWPNARLAPRDLPLGLAGPEAATAPVEHRLAAEGNAFDLHRYRDASEAREAIEHRDVYGAFVASPTGPTLLTSPAASPFVAAMLEHAFVAPGGPAAAARLVEVVPADSDDPRGTVFGALILPLVLSSIVLGVVVALTVRPGLAQAAVLLAASSVGGLVATAMVDSWLGAISGGTWLVNAGVLALTMLAIASLIAGLNALVGHAGIGIGAAVMVLVGNAWSGVASAPELLPKPLGAIGQLLPPGAGGNLLRSVVFFDGARATRHLAVVLACATLGLAAIWAGATVRGAREVRRSRRRDQAAEGLA